MLAPVQKDAAEEARKRTASPTSSGVPIRPIGTTSLTVARRLSLSISVSIGPGETAFTRMPSRPTSRESPTQNALIAAFDAAYQTNSPGEPYSVARDESSTIEPP